MSFNSFDFLYFFVAIYTVYLLLEHRAQNLWLLLASYVFYAYWDYRFLALLLLSTITDFVAGLSIGRATDKRVRQRWLLLSISVNLGILGVFKYFGFFVDSLERAAAGFGWSFDAPTLDLVLPLGISFYTFQTLSYTIDVYRGRRKPTHRISDFALFVGFFPQLVAGPIERASKLIPQIEQPRRIASENVDRGLWLIVQGYFLKLVVADNLAPFTSAVFGYPELAHSGDVLFAIYAFPFQVYGDFAGYSRIARGTALLLGFELSTNFRRPHLAPNPAEQWKRWHVTLSRWFRDYVFMPLNRWLGGSKTRRGRSAVAAFVTLCASGLWHGAAWHFVLWGAMHGAALIAFHRFNALRASRRRTAHPARWRHALAVFLNFHFWCVVALSFGARSVSDVVTLLGALVAAPGPPSTEGLYTFVAFALPVAIAEIVEEARARDLWSTGTRLFRHVARLVLCVLIVLAGATGSREFIYFRF